MEEISLLGEEEMMITRYRVPFWTFPNDAQTRGKLIFWLINDTRKTMDRKDSMSNW
jgi:hypothetical protein